MPASDHEPQRLEKLWAEYGSFLDSWDDLTLARWMAQTLSQLNGRIWRQSHPLIGSYRLAAVAAHQRGLKLYRVASIPHDYTQAECCGAPLLPFITRDVVEDGVICLHCNSKALEFESLPAELQASLRSWTSRYDPVHAVAHWTEEQKRRSDYDQAYNHAAGQAEDLLNELAQEILPDFLDHYPALIWEDHDTCLDVQPDDLLSEPSPDET
ncbi:MAG: hypothetical protein HC904_08045 [Blastochloris sp.]|nr:hypothetical protein [Blastochloris sp.]